MKLVKELLKKAFHTVGLEVSRYNPNRTGPAASTAAERRHALVGPPELWESKRAFQIAFLKNAGLDPHDYLLDIGCGTLRGGLPIIDFLDTGHYFGIEARKEVLDEGKEELKESHLSFKNPTLILGQPSSSLSLPQKFQIIWAFSVLIHMTDDILLRTLEFASSHLVETGRFYANVNLGHQEEGKWQGFPVVRRSQGFYKQACAGYGLELCILGCLKDLGHTSTDKQQDEQVMLDIRRVG